MTGHERDHARMGLIAPESTSAELLDAVCRSLGVRTLVMFGSNAPGGLPTGPESDLDLAFSYHPRAVRRLPLDLHDAFAAVFPDQTLDLVELPAGDPLFRWEIMREGVLLHGDLDEFLDYRAFAYRDFVDSADLRELERVLSEKKLALIREQLRAAS
jgi:predicted nucleotidyltransferase